MTTRRTRARRVAMRVLTVIVIVPLVGGVLYGAYWLGGYWLLGGLTLGILLIPGLNLLLGQFPGSGFLAKLLFAMGNVTNNGSALVYDEYASTIVPYNDTTNQLYVNNEWTAISQDELTTYRIGLRPFGISMNPDLLDEYTVEDDITGAPVVSGERGGEYVCAPFDSPDEDSGWVLVDWMRFLERVGRSGTRLYNRAEEDALKKYAGGDRLSQMHMALLALGDMVVMFVVTWVMLSL